MCADKSHFVVSLSDYKKVDIDETAMSGSLAQVGPLSVALNASLLQFYKSGVFDPPDMLCNKEDLDHAVLMVG